MTEVALSRRAFLGSIAALVGAAAAPAFSIGRLPFVVEGEFVSSIVWHMWDKPLAPCSISMLVESILPWDGTGFPLVLARTGFRYEDRERYAGWYDFEWSNLRRDVPERFWAMPGASRYPNIHAYVREQRFGEDPTVMARTMAKNQASGSPANRPIARRISPKKQTANKPSLSESVSENMSDDNAAAAKK
jgi:hypothetical protein